MNLSKKQYIEKLALGIRKALKIQTPIDLKKVISLLSGSIICINDIEYNSEAKITKKDNNTFEIALNSSNNTNERENFTIAHELGHLFLHMGYLIDNDKWNSINEYTDSVYYRYGYNEEEFEANEFAANFLMPKEEFIDIVLKNLNENNICDFKKVADYFNVSHKAVIIRSKWLGLISWDLDA